MIEIPLSDETILFIMDEVGEDGCVEVTIDDKIWGEEATFWMNKDQALKIVEHLEKVFGLERNSKTQEA